MNAAVRNKVLLRGEHSDNAVSIVESTMPAGTLDRLCIHTPLTRRSTSSTAR
jgi:hypothetical protein